MLFGNKETYSDLLLHAKHERNRLSQAFEGKMKRNLFAYPVTKITATAVVKVIMNTLCKHTYLPTTILTGSGTQFNSKVSKEVTLVLGIELKRATTNRPKLEACLREHS